MALTVTRKLVIVAGAVSVIILNALFVVVVIVVGVVRDFRKGRGKNA